MGRGEKGPLSDPGPELLLYVCNRPVAPVEYQVILEPGIG